MSYHVHKTNVFSITLRGRRMNVKKTLRAYWETIVKESHEDGNQWYQIVLSIASITSRQRRMDVKTMLRGAWDSTSYMKLLLFHLNRLQQSSRYHQPKLCSWFCNDVIELLQRPPSFVGPFEQHNIPREKPMGRLVWRQKRQFSVFTGINFMLYITRAIVQYLKHIFR